MKQICGSETNAAFTSTVNESGGAVRMGQPVVVRSAAFPGHDFVGKVSSVAPIIGPVLRNHGPNRKNAIVSSEVVTNRTRGILSAGIISRRYFAGKKNRICVVPLVSTA